MEIKCKNVLNNDETKLTNMYNWAIDVSNATQDS